MWGMMNVLIESSGRCCIGYNLTLAQTLTLYPKHGGDLRSCCPAAGDFSYVVGPREASGVGLGLTYRGEKNMVSAKIDVRSPLWICPPTLAYSLYPKPSQTLALPRACAICCCRGGHRSQPRA